jgi:hypothetical protein
MILYHGSKIAVPNPDICYSRDNLDFGKGFYTTPIKEQAERWAKRMGLHANQGIVSSYRFDEVKANDNLTIITFDDCTEEWLDFIINCRTGMISIAEADIIVGGVANDRVFNTIELFFDGLIAKEEAIKRLRFDEPNKQYCFRSQSAINEYLEYIGSEEIK